MKKGIWIGILTLLVVIAGISAMLARNTVQDKNAIIPVSTTEALSMGKTEDKHAENTEMQEETPKSDNLVNSETEEAKNEKIIAPTVVSIIQEDKTTDVIILAGENNQDVVAKAGVVKTDIDIGDFEGSTEEVAQNQNENTIEEAPKETEEQFPDTPEEITEEETSESTTSQKEQSSVIDQSIGYEDYEAMSSEKQMLFYYSFANADAFLEWYNNAKAEYEAGLETIYIGADGIVKAGN